MMNAPGSPISSSHSKSTSYSESFGVNEVIVVIQFFRFAALPSFPFNLFPGRIKVKNVKMCN